MIYNMIDIVLQSQSTYLMMKDFLPLCFSNLPTNVLPFAVKMTFKMKYYSHFIIAS